MNLEARISSKKKKILWAAIAGLAAIGLALVVIPNGMRFTGWLLLGVAALWVVEEFLRWMEPRSHLWALCYKLFFGCLTLLLGALAVIEMEVFKWSLRDNAAIPVDAVIVLGAGVNGETPSASLQSRIDAARVYLESHPDIPVVLTGGKGSAERISEAEAMRRGLWTDDEAWNARLILEDQAVSTSENFRFSRELLEERLDLDSATIAVVTSDYHCFRSHLLAKRYGIKTAEIPSTLPWWWLNANYFIRESFAVVKAVLFG